MTYIVQRVQVAKILALWSQIPLREWFLKPETSNISGTWTLWVRSSITTNSPTL